MQNRGNINIILNSAKLYFKNILPFSRVMAFPVIGHLVGIFWILGGCYLILSKLLVKLPQETLVSNMVFIILGMVVALVPGFIIFLKAFWKLLVTFISTVLISEDAIKGNKIKNLREYYIQVINRKNEYIVLLLIISLIWLVLLLAPSILFITLSVMGIAPALGVFGAVFFTFISMVVLGVISIYLSLSYQVFAFEKLKPLQYLQKSWKLVDKSFKKVFGLIVLYLIVATLLSFLIALPFSVFGLNEMIAAYFQNGVSYYTDSIVKFYNLANVPNISSLIIQMPVMVSDLVINFIIGTLLLPFGSLCFIMLYQALVSANNGKKKKS